MDSFYGGKQGFSFIIVKSFASVAEMVQNFQQGPNYTEVHYNEHVLINTENKNDPDNGAIYRRGYDYSNETTGGAIYIGSIVGPAGKAPMLELTTVDKVKEKQPEEGYDYRYGEGEYAPLDNLIPGYDVDTGEYNDKISWAYCSIRDENESDCIAYIGFKIPYPVFEFQATKVSPYFNSDFIDRIDDKSHTFYSKYNINIPQGIKGDSFKNLKSVIANSNIQDYEGKQDDIDNNREVLVYEYYDYSEDESGNPATYYLGDFNMIKNISLDSDGTFTIEYTHQDNYSTSLNWVNNIEIDADGNITLKYSNGQADTVLPNKLKFIKNIFIQTNTEGGDEGSGDQRVHIQYTDEDSDIAIGNPLNYIIETAITNDFHYLIYYSDPAKRTSNIEYNGKTGWVDLGSIKDDSGILIGLNIDSSSIEPNLNIISNAVNYLNSLYPNGLTNADGSNLLGKVITIGIDGMNKMFYAFDYNRTDEGLYKGWYYLGTFESTIESFHMISKDESTEEIELKKSKLASGGIWFVVSEV